MGKAGVGLTAAKARTLKVVQLRRELQARGLDAAGLKPALLARLLAALTPPPPPPAAAAEEPMTGEPGEEEEEDVEKEDEDEEDEAPEEVGRTAAEGAARAARGAETAAGRRAAGAAKDLRRQRAQRRQGPAAAEGGELPEELLAALGAAHDRREAEAEAQWEAAEREAAAGPRTKGRTKKRKATRREVGGGLAVEVRAAVGELVEEGRAAVIRRAGRGQPSAAALAFLHDRLHGPGSLPRGPPGSKPSARMIKQPRHLGRRGPAARFATSN